MQVFMWCFWPRVFYVCTPQCMTIYLSSNLFRQTRIKLTFQPDHHYIISCQQDSSWKQNYVFEFFLISCILSISENYGVQCWSGCRIFQQLFYSMQKSQFGSSNMFLNRNFSIQFEFGMNLMVKNAFIAKTNTALYNAILIQCYPHTMSQKHVKKLV